MVVVLHCVVFSVVNDIALALQHRECGWCMCAYTWFDHFRDLQSCFLPFLFFSFFPSLFPSMDG